MIGWNELRRTCTSNWINIFFCCKWDPEHDVYYPAMHIKRGQHYSDWIFRYKRAKLSDGRAHSSSTLSCLQHSNALHFGFNMSKLFLQVSWLFENILSWRNCNEFIHVIIWWWSRFSSWCSCLPVSFTPIQQVFVVKMHFLDWFSFFKLYAVFLMKMMKLTPSLVAQQ